MGILNNRPEPTVIWDQPCLLNSKSLFTAQHPSGCSRWMCRRRSVLSCTYYWMMLWDVCRLQNVSDSLNAIHFVIFFSAIQRQYLNLNLDTTKICTNTCHTFIYMCAVSTLFWIIIGLFSKVTENSETAMHNLPRLSFVSLQMHHLIEES